MHNKILSKLKPVAIFVYFLSIGFSSFFVFTSISLTTIMQILTILILIVGLIFKFYTSKLSGSARTLVYFLGFIPITLFMNILIFSTGGLSSPFIILSHFTAITLAFLISPEAAIGFIIANILLILSNLTIDPTARQFVTENSFAAFLYMIAYVALIPISYAIAKEYKRKEEWANILEKQILTSQTQEEALLKNIKDAVIVIDTEFKITYFNEAAEKLVKIQKAQLGQEIFKIFAFKDKDGRNLQSFSLPFTQTLSSKTPSTFANIQVSNQGADFQKVDIKLLPAIDAKGTIGIVIVLEDRTNSEKTQKHQENTALLALSKFLLIINDQNKTFQKIKKALTDQDISKLQSQNRLLEHLAQDYFYSLRLESGQAGELSELLDLGTVTQQLIVDQTPIAKDLGQVIQSPGQKTAQEIIAPKNDMHINIEKRIFPEVFVLGNISWIKDSLSKILYLVYLINPKDKPITLNVKRNDNLGQIILDTAITSVPLELAPALFEKFYADKIVNPLLSDTSGLEGYIAKSLLERIGANIIIEESKRGLLFTITLGLHSQKPNFTGQPTLPKEENKS